MRNPPFVTTMSTFVLQPGYTCFSIESYSGRCHSPDNILVHCKIVWQFLVDLSDLLSYSLHYTIRDLATRLARRRSFFIFIRIV